MISVPVRAALVFAATEYETAPLPVPVEPAVIVIQLALLRAFQLQELPVTTFTEPVPPANAKDWLCADNE